MPFRWLWLWLLCCRNRDAGIKIPRNNMEFDTTKAKEVISSFTLKDAQTYLEGLDKGLTSHLKRSNYKVKSV